LALCSQVIDFSLNNLALLQALLLLISLISKVFIVLSRARNFLFQHFDLGLILLLHGSDLFIGVLLKLQQLHLHFLQLQLGSTLLNLCLLQLLFEDVHTIGAVLQHAVGPLQFLVKLLFGVFVPSVEVFSDLLLTLSETCLHFGLKCLQLGLELLLGLCSLLPFKCDVFVPCLRLLL